jgi:hypothetical protein
MMLLLFVALNPFRLFASEVIEEKTRVIIREHPKTGKPYVSIVSSDVPEPPDPFTGQKAKILRPDYRMLDPKMKSGEIPYEGPVSDRTKIYVLAASLATLGVAGPALLPAAAPAAAGSAGATGGAGALAAAGTAVTVGPVAAVAIAGRPDPDKDDYDREAGYRNIGSGEAACEEGEACSGAQRPPRVSPPRKRGSMARDSRLSARKSADPSFGGRGNDTD